MQETLATSLIFSKKFFVKFHQRSLKFCIKSKIEILSNIENIKVQEHKVLDKNLDRKVLPVDL